MSISGPSQLTTNKKKKRRVIFCFILGSFLISHLFFRVLPNVFEIWNLQTTDLLFLARSSIEKLRPAYDPTIVHVDLNNASIQKLDTPYVNRRHFAKLARNLAAMAVSAQVYDFIFAAPTEKANDQSFIDATAEAGNAYFGLAFELGKTEARGGANAMRPEDMRYLDQTKWGVVVKGGQKGFYVGEHPLITFGELASAARGLGFISVRFDRDGALRRVPLLVRFKDAYYPALGFRVICDFLNVPPEKIVVHPGKYILLRDARRPNDHQTHDIVIPIDKQGNLIVNYIGPWERMDHYNFADILSASDDREEMALWKEELNGKIVVISDVSTGSADIGPVPMDSNFPLSGVHAHVIHNILTGSFVKALSQGKMLFIEVMLLGIVLILSLRFSSFYFSFGSLLLAGSYVAIAGMAFFYGHIIFHIIRPLLMLAFAVTSILVYRYVNEEREKLEGLRQRDFIRATFGRYLSNEVVDTLLNSPTGLKMSGETREVTFLVSDFRGFTSLSSTLTPQEVISMLNYYFENMIEIIARYGGTVDEFQGDGILVFFGAPLMGNDDPGRAVACAIEMQNKMKVLNEKQRSNHQTELVMGIGINTGEVIVGNIGSTKRSKYGAVGQPINAAYRIESYTTGGQILISGSTYKKIQPLVRIQGKKEVQFKGIDHVEILYDVVGMAGPFHVFLTVDAVGEFVELTPPLPVTCYRMKGKMVLETAIECQITHIAQSSAKLFVPDTIGADTSIKILMADPQTHHQYDVYAKVVAIEKPDVHPSHTIAHVEFGWLPDEVKTILQKRKNG